MAITINVNGTDRTVDVEEDTPLLWVLRDVLHMNGTKFGCGAGLCGSCTVHVDGEAQFACQTAVGDVGKAKVTTIEALQDSPVGRAVQQAWIDTDVVQCGYCQPGHIMRAAALLAKTPHPDEEQIRSTMSANLCRCGCYSRIYEAIRTVAEKQEKAA